MRTNPRFWSERQDSNLRPDGPKPPALSTAPRPDVLNYTTNALFLQVVKSVVKTFCWCFFEKGNTRKSECFQGFSAFLKTHGRKLPARSQTSRATNCATSRYFISFHWQLSATLPVAVTASRIAKVFAIVLRRLPLLIPRFITHRVRSEMSPTALHPETVNKLFYFHL